MVKISVRDIVNNSVELSRVYLEDKGIELQTDVSEDFEIVADFDKLTAVIINLIKNASEAFELKEDDCEKSGKYIKIKTEKRDNGPVITLSNNAPAIENPDRIFDYGFTTKSDGDGLGLWICKKSIEAQNGYLKLVSSNDDCTEFVIGMESAE